jgi:hypothetical protein
MVSDAPMYCLPTDDGIPVLSPLQRGIEQRETLHVLRFQLQSPPTAEPGLKAVLRNLDLLFVEE